MDATDRTGPLSLRTTTTAAPTTTTTETTTTTPTSPNNSQLRADSLSVPNSPKAKSAPATPCNITPTAFHQTNPLHLSSLLNPSPANTMPTDTRKKISATCRVLPSSISMAEAAAVAAASASTATNGQLQQQQQQTSSRTLVLTSGSNQQATVSLQHLDDLIKRGENALESNDNHGAIRYFGRCIELASANPNSIDYLKKNFKIYGHKAQAHFNLGNYKEAIDDSMAARDFNPKWTQAYYLQGQSQFFIGQYADSLAVFSFGLAQEPTNKLLFAALVKAALESPFIRSEFEPKYEKLKSLDLNKRPFVVVSVLGQELLAKGHGEHAAIILESSLKMKSDNLKFKGSVLSAIARAYSMMKDYEKATVYMLKELEVETELEDASGQCRVLKNLGFAYFKMRKFETSLKRHRDQLNLAMKTKQWQQASIALNAIGHIHAAKGDFSDALTSHTRCFDILKQLSNNAYSQFNELLSIGYVYSMLNDLKSAEDRYQEAIQLLESSCAPGSTSGDGKTSQEEFTVGHIMANFNLAYLSLKNQSFLRAKQHYETVMRLAQSIADPKLAALYEMRAANGMGHAHRLYKKFEEAKVWFERQLQLAESLEDLSGQSQALCNLGMTYQHFKDYNQACRLFEENLKLVDKNPHLKAYACSYIGSMCFLAGRYNEAQVHYETSSNLFKDLDYCSAEKSTVDLNMAIAATHNNQTTTVAPATTTHQKKVMMAT